MKQLRDSGIIALLTAAATRLLDSWQELDSFSSVAKMPAPNER
ncbi:unannotated protein [freshwater metagenome]|uniref:Unannotated protein n=1 Tax=freshwater metagenome TaxID=449393 RepID=A0A6J6MMR9_9ZZZZ